MTKTRTIDGKTQVLENILDFAMEALTHIRQDGEDLFYCLEEDNFYRYEHGVWRPIFDIQVLKLCCFHVEALLKRTISQRKNVVENLKTVIDENLENLNKCKMMNLINVMVDPLSGIYCPHDKKYLSTIRIPYIYDPNAKCELWLKTLNEIFEGHQEKIDTLQEAYGYALIPDSKQKKAFLLIGDSDSGKTTLFNMLRDALGAENSSSVPLKYIANPQYTPNMVNKLANIDPDVGRDANNYEGDFKIITSGEPVICNQKFVATFKFVPYCRIFMAANEFPNITDHSSAFYKRLIIIPCERIFSTEEMDRNLGEKLKQELPGVLNWMIAGLQRLNARGRFLQCDFSRDAVDELRELNNPIDTFSHDYIEHKNGEEINKTELYGIYRQWCNANKIGELSSIKFNKLIYERFHKYTGKKDRSSLGNRPWVWKNLRLLNNSMYQKQEDVQWSE